MPRCAKLELSLNWEALTPYIAGISTIAFPRLHSVSHNVNVDRDEHAATAWFWRVVRTAPNLASVYEMESNPSHVDALPFNPSTLTTLRLGGVDGVSELRSILVNNPKLETLEVRALLLWSFELIPEDISPQVLPCLRDLKIYCGTPVEEWFGLFDSLRMPALRSLWIGGAQDTENDLLEEDEPMILYHSPPISVTSTLYRCASSLRLLTLQFNPISYHELEITNLVQNLPNLSHFRFATYAPVPGISACTAHLLSRLKLPLDIKLRIHALAPSLEWLEIREFNFCPRVEQELIEKVLTMASSRSTTSLARSGLEGVASLSKVHLSWMKHEDHDSDSDESGSEHGDDSDSDSGSDPESDDSDWSCVKFKLGS
ncbi:hypothetical protein VNI00_012735 [Paramarasmius palmivorus]|uniref:Uncharacterized protein n=1 Tax=Paramarasmius palmivorus TaxID=297713 RepID=A0AAW0C3U7_9AGAR